MQYYAKCSCWVVCICGKSMHGFMFIIKVGLEAFGMSCFSPWYSKCLPLSNQSWILHQPSGIFLRTLRHQCRWRLHRAGHGGRAAGPALGLISAGGRSLNFGSGGCHKTCIHWDKRIHSTIILVPQNDHFCIHVFMFSFYWWPLQTWHIRSIVFLLLLFDSARFVRFWHGS